MSSVDHLGIVPLAVRPDLNMLTVDVECWDQIICRKLTGRLMAPSKATLSRIRGLLSMLKELDVKATFFVVGTVAEAFPDVVREMDAAGHEVGVHGFSHRPIWNQSPREFAQEVRRARELVTDLLGKPVLGFRAPEFSIVQDTLWALNVLRDEGFKYDSSIVPVPGVRFGIPDFPQNPVRVGSGRESIVEVPPSVVSVLGRRQLAAGGGYFRLMPGCLIRRVVRSVNRSGRPFVLYCHPYEFGDERLSCKGFPVAPDRIPAMRTELRFNLFRRSMAAKLERLIREYPFTSVEEVLHDELEG